MNKPILLLLPIIFSLHSFSQVVYSLFPDPTGEYSTTSSGICFSCSISNPSNVADSDPGNYATIVVSAGVGASRGIRAKLPSLVPGNTKAGFYINIGTVVSSLPSVTLTTYKSGSFRETILSNGNIVTLTGGSEGYVCASASPLLDYDEVGISFNGGALTVGLSANVFYAFGGGSTCPVAVLPLNRLDVYVDNTSDVPLITWKTGNDNDVSYHLQRSYDGKIFTTIYTQTGTAGKPQNVFTFYDRSVSGKIVYYRVESVNKNSSLYFFSKTVRILRNADNQQNSSLIYPNPLRGNNFTMNVSSLTSSSYHLVIIDASGRIADLPMVTTKSGVINATLQKKLPAGIYTTRLTIDNTGQLVYCSMIILE